MIEKLNNVVGYEKANKSTAAVPINDYIEQSRKLNEVIDFINANNSHQIDTNVGNTTSFGSINRKLHILENCFKQQELINSSHSKDINEHDEAIEKLKKEVEMIKRDIVTVENHLFKEAPAPETTVQEEDDPYAELPICGNPYPYGINPLTKCPFMLKKHCNKKFYIGCCYPE
jgi:hypothetical protein